MSDEKGQTSDDTKAKDAAVAENLSKKFGIPPASNVDMNKPILVVDDQQDLRLIIAHHLQKLGFKTVIQAGNGLEALEKFEEHGEFSIIVSDIDMPHLGGFDFLKELKENPDLPRGPFCIAMDTPSKEKIMLSVENGVDEILVKPFTLNDIVPKVRNAFKVFHNPKNPEKVYEFAKSFIKSSEPDKAIAIYNDLHLANKKAARPLVGIARCHLLKNDTAKALESLQSAEEANPNYVHLYVVKGNIYADQKKFAEASAAYRKAIELSPLNPIRYQKAAEVMFSENKYQEAIELLNIAIKNELDFPGLHHYLSQAYIASKDYKAAIKHIKSALSADPENVTYLNQLGICYKDAEMYEEATSTYNKIIKADPDNVAALYNKAVMLHTKGDKEGAVKILERLVSKDPGFKAAQTKLKEYTS